MDTLPEVEFDVDMFDDEPDTHPEQSNASKSQWGEKTLSELPSIGFSGDMSKTVVPERPGQRKYRDLGQLAKYVPNKLENLRGAHPQYNNKQIYDDLINILLNAKKDITRIEGLDDYENATKYAQKHGYRITKREADINHDGVNDVVLYDKKGNPIIVNGYKLSPSKQPLRKLYEKAKREQTLSDPAAGYRGYVKQLYGVEGEFDDEGNRPVRYDKTNLPPELQPLKLHGWSIPTAPKKNFTKRLSPTPKRCSAKRLPTLRLPFWILKNLQTRRMRTAFL